MKQYDGLGFVPMDILENILSRLRVKPLMRFKCVSKDWNNLITTNRDFFKLHLTRQYLKSNNNNTHLLIFIVKHRTGCTHLYTLDLKTLMNFPRYEREHAHAQQQLPKLELELERLPNSKDSRTIPVGSCNGLVCLRNKVGSGFALYNPSTRTHFKLPDIGYDDLISYGRIYGFGFDSSSHDYKVVKIAHYDYLKSHSKDAVTKVMVYSWKNNRWKEYNYWNHHLYPLISSATVSCCDAIFSNNALHWAVNDGVIVCFDLCTEKFHDISIPPSKALDFQSSTHPMLANLGGFMHMVWDNGLWINMEESWIKLGSFEKVDTRPIRYCHTGNQVLVQRLSWPRSFDWVDLATGKTTVTSQRLPWYFHLASVSYVESLVAPRNFHQHSKMGKHKKNKGIN